VEWDRAEWGLWVLESSSQTSQDNKIWIGPPKLTRFEKARIAGARALQISMGAPILVEPSQNLSNPIDIALKELEFGILPMTIRRTLPDGTFQDIPLKWLLRS
jgi:DNA-directed RNA polymerase subunit K/omega